MNKRTTFLNGEYYFQDRVISKKEYQKIRYGNWSHLTLNEIVAKLDRKKERAAQIEGFQIIYEKMLETPLGQYALGIAQEKTANSMLKLLKKIKNEGRRLVRKNKLKVSQNGLRQINGRNL